MTLKPVTTKQIKLIVGLGNPGSQYEATRHNIGFRFVELLAEHHDAHFKPEKKLKSDVAKAALYGHEILLAKPHTFMNLSGEAVQKLAHFYKLTPEEILIVHDELDLPCGIARLKKGGGHGGHNGLRDISAKLPNTDYYRLRLGIGHPGDARQVSVYVLSRPSQAEIESYINMISKAADCLPDVLDGHIEKAMTRLHS